MEKKKFEMELAVLTATNSTKEAQSKLSTCEFNLQLKEQEVHFFFFN